MSSPPGAVLSIQSQVSYGHVGNSAARLPLQRLGFDVFPIDTVQLAHHPGHGAWRGHKVEPERLREILRGLEERGALACCTAVLSGYLGDPEVADLVCEAVRAVRRTRSGAVYLCDPVIGDDGPGVFVAAGIPERMRADLIPIADIVTPNRFELSFLTGQAVARLDDAIAAAAAIRALGPSVVVATGLPADRPGHVAVLAASGNESWHVTTPRIPIVLGGSGDAFSALFLGHYLRAGNLRLGLERAVSAIFALIELSSASGADELRLVAAQDELASPQPRFSAERL